MGWEIFNIAGAALFTGLTFAYRDYGYSVVFAFLCGLQIASTLMGGLA